MKVGNFVIYFSIISISCFGQSLDDPKYKLIDGYIYAENLEHKEFDCKDCDNENKIFRINKKFHYSYKYVDANRSAFLFKILDNGNWNFVSISSNEPNVVRSVELLILPNGERFHKEFFCQTRIGYKLNETFLNYTTTGLIENKKNVWIHPPREYLFHILELNPFPYIKFPYVIGNKWEWELAIGPQWSDKRWKVWTGEIHSTYHYKITDIKTINTNLGLLKCYIVEGIAKSELGETYLKSYFTEEYGFVKLEYKNIDNSTIELALERIENTSLFKSPSSF